MKPELTTSASVSVLLIILLVSCSPSPDSASDARFSDLPVAEHRLISEFDRSGDFYFQSLLQTSVSLPGSDVLLADQQGNFVIRVDRDGNFVSEIAREGSGPGEVRDPISMHRSGETSILIYDQARKVMIRKSLDQSEVQEFTPPNVENFRVSRVYPTHRDNIIHLNLSDFSFVRDPDSEPADQFAAWQTDTEEVLKRFDYPSDLRAVVQLRGRPGGAIPVPYTPKFLYDYSHDRSELYTFWSGNSSITVLDSAEFDTLRTIPVSLPSEQMSASERDSLQENYRSEFWPDIRDLLPEQKSPADKMILDQQDRIWLKLTLRSDQSEWIVLDQNGDPEMRVQLPKEGTVTHISNEHIGIRADPSIFSLYELVE